MTLETFVHIKKVQAQMLEVAINGHAYLADHGNHSTREYHHIQAVILNKEYRELTGQYYLFNILKGGLERRK